jgi:hypothetical protein
MSTFKLSKFLLGSAAAQKEIVDDGAEKVKDRHWRYGDSQYPGRGSV